MSLWLDLGAEYARRRAVMLGAAVAPPPLLTEALIAPLPAAVQRYLRVCGWVGRPLPRSVQVDFDATMYSKPGAAGMRGPAVQLDRFDLPRRLFFMRTRMAGLPVAVLHDYAGTQASMQVRLASLFKVVDLKGEALARTETVTLLNDLCFFAPAWLADTRLAWTALDAQRCTVAFTQGPYRVQAELVFNDAGELVNFHSDDRGALQKDGSLRLLHWSTPMRGYRAFDGRRVATEGEAVYTYPEGDFAYGRFVLKQIRFDVVP
ncbi:MAG: hypothetical protein Q8K45_19280 [Rubrivivax sp.]|nr:hypothetical protein [Rubrivivax sp.]